MEKEIRNMTLKQLRIQVWVWLTVILVQTALVWGFHFAYQETGRGGFVIAQYLMLASEAASLVVFWQRAKAAREAAE